MCGIAGFWLAGPDLATTPEAALRRMTDAIAHRGPDDQAQLFDAQHGVGLGHRRLSIVDLSPDGRQPMASPSGRYQIVFNGELYNFREIRAELAAGEQPPLYRGGSDTEVMLAAIDAWGLEAAVARFVGMFAFALWDTHERCLSLCRDRLGVKPLCYAFTAQGVLFGSELGALLAFPGFRPSIDQASVSDFLRFGYVQAPHSIYAGVAKLEPGCILSIRAPRADAGRATRYWDARRVAALAQQSASPSPATLLDELDELLRSAVKLRLFADVPLGAFLSGGIDSSLVVALMQAQSTQRVRTFSIGSDLAEFDESGAAASVAAHLGTDHTAFVVTSSEAQRVVPELGDLYDEPFADSSQIPTLLVSRLARQHVTVALTGDGGDEAFGGYNRYLWGPRVWGLLRTLPSPLRRQLGQGLNALAASGHDESLGNLLPARLRPRMLNNKLRKLGDVLAVDSREAFYASLCAQWQDPAQVLRVDRGRGPNLPEVRTGSFASDMMLLDLLTYLPGDVLTKVDRATMAVPIEARSPFLDHRVVEFGWRLPVATKLQGSVGKWPLRQLLYRYVPRELVDRPKMGFAVPVGAWLKGGLRGWAEELLSEAALRDQGYFQPQIVQQTLRQHLAGTHDHAARLWCLLMFQSWLKGRHSPSSAHP